MKRLSSITIVKIQHFFLSQLLLFKTVPLFFMKKIKFTEKESKNMFDILCQIYDGLRDKNGRKKTNKLPLHEVMWYKAIDEFMNKGTMLRGRKPEQNWRLKNNRE